MVIEFTGIPGSGKSTIFKKLSEVLKGDKYIFDVQKYIMGFNSNMIIYDIVLIFNFFRLNIKDWKLLGKIFKIVINSKNSLFHKINILRNNYKRIVIYRIISSKKNKIFFIDEGISHIPFTLFVDIEKSINIKKVKNFIQMLPQANKTLIVDAPDDVLLKRVISRGKTGHRRINFTKKEDIVCFMQQSHQVLELLKEQVDGCIYQNIKPNIDLSIIKKILGLKNV